MNRFTRYIFKLIAPHVKPSCSNKLNNIQMFSVVLLLFCFICLLIDLHDILIYGVSFIIISLASFDKSKNCNKFPCGFTPDQFPEKIFFKDINLVYRMASHTYAQYLNCNPNEIHGKTDFDLYPPELAQKFENDDKKVLKNKKSQELIYEYYHNDKRYIIKTVKSIMLDQSGNPVGISGIIYDISESAILQEQLTENQRKLSTLLSNLPCMAYRCLNDDDWSMEFVSNGCEELTGYPASMIINNAEISYSDIIHKADRKMVWDVIQQQIERTNNLI